MQRAGVSTSVQVVSIVVAFLIGLGIMYVGASSLMGTKTTTVVTTSVSTKTVTVSGSVSSTTSSSVASSTSSSSTSSSASTGGPPILIGMSTFLSGGNVIVGTQQVDGASLAINEINAQGGVLGRQLKLVTQDEATSAQTAVNTLIDQNNVSFLIGPFYSGEVESVLPTTYSHKIVQLLVDASLDALLVPPQNKYLFMVNLDDNGSAFQSAQWLSLIHAKNYMFLGEDYVYAHEVANQTVALAQPLGITMSSSQFFPGSATDYTAAISQVATANPNAVVVDMSGSNVLSFAKQWGANPITAKIPVLYIWSVLTAPSFAQSVGSGINYAFVGSTSTITNQTAAFNTKFSATFNGLGATPYAYDSYDSIQVLALAIKAAGSTNPDAVAAALQNTDYVGPGGHLAFNSIHGPVVKLGYYTGYVSQIIVNGSAYHYGIVWPSYSANTTAINPATGTAFS